METNSPLPQGTPQLSFRLDQFALLVYPLCNPNFELGLNAHQFGNSMV